MIKIRRSICLIALTATAITTTAFANDKSEAFIGYAYDLKTQELLYTEQHSYPSAVIHDVKYKEPDGKLFANKTIDYQYSYHAPNILQKNNRNGELIDIKRIEDKDGQQETLIKYQENKKESIKTGSVNNNSNLVIDAGFNQFIIKHWDTLIAGKKMTIDYLIPSALDHYELSIKKESCEDKGQHCFSISASSFLISLFSSDLKLTYKITENNHIRLISFQGRSNICDSEGDYQDVKIIYQYEQA